KSSSRKSQTSVQKFQISTVREKSSTPIVRPKKVGSKRTRNRASNNEKPKESSPNPSQNHQSPKSPTLNQASRPETSNLPKEKQEPSSSVQEPSSSGQEQSGASTTSSSKDDLKPPMYAPEMNVKSDEDTFTHVKSLEWDPAVSDQEHRKR
uniref:Uncharacterized protein n=1 Tax=Panagrolaimus sp. JU765 TaxID=591449 RepID=A0AC34QEZ1_9BILA